MTMQPTTKSHTEISFRTQPAAPLRVMGERITPQVDRALGAAAFEVFEVEFGEGSGPPPHGHPWAEGYVVLEGQLASSTGPVGSKNPQSRSSAPVARRTSLGASSQLPGAQRAVPVHGDLDQRRTCLRL